MVTMASIATKLALIVQRRRTVIMSLESVLAPVHLAIKESCVIQVIHKK